MDLVVYIELTVLKEVFHTVLTLNPSVGNDNMKFERNCRYISEAFLVGTGQCGIISRIDFLTDGTFLRTPF